MLALVAGLQTEVAGFTKLDSDAQIKLITDNQISAYLR